MKNKLLKQIKILLSLLIVISLTFPSYAAIVSSDGSAFVTKQEFDTFASEVTLRLSSFQTNVISRIESQVSSYLEKNGIWSAKKQITSPLCYGVAVGYSIYTISNFTPGDYTTKIMSKQILVPKINKSGLVHIKVMSDKGDSSNAPKGGKLITEAQYNSSITSVSGPNGFCIMFYGWGYNEANRINDLFMRGTAKSHLYLYINDVMKSDIIFADSYATPTSSSTSPSSSATFSERCVTMVTSTFNTDIYFFVMRGEELSFDLTFALKGFYYGNTGYKPSNIDSGTSSSYYYIKFSEIAIY